MQSYEFKVVGIDMDADRVEFRLQGKFHPTFSSLVFLKLPIAEAGALKLGDRVTLEPEPVETVPFYGVDTDGTSVCLRRPSDGIKYSCTLPAGHSGPHEAHGLTDILRCWSDSSDQWADGSPVPAEEGGA